MAGGVSRKSPWAVRLAILGALFLVIGTIIVSAQKEAIDSVVDPREMAIAQIEGEGLVTFDVQKNGCYMAVVLVGESEMDVTLTPTVSAAAATEELTPKSCFSDWTPMASDGAAFEIHEQWVAGENGGMLAQSTCNEECEGQTVWLVHTNGWEWKLLESSGLVFGLGICCLGFLFLPVAGILVYSARSKAVHGSLKVLDRDGVLLHSFDSQEEMMAAMHGINSPLENDVDNQEIGDVSEPDDGFIDGSNDVMKGTLMTTEQVYGFMRGDMPEAVRQVEDPFADSPTPPFKQPVKKPIANIEEISDWDAGGSSDVAKPSNPKTPKKPNDVKKEKDGSKDWAVWDDV